MKVIVFLFCLSAAYGAVVLKPAGCTDDAGVDQPIGSVYVKECYQCTCTVMGMEQCSLWVYTVLFIRYRYKFIPYSPHRITTLPLYGSAGDAVWIGVSYLLCDRRACFQTSIWMISCSHIWLIANSSSRFGQLCISKSTVLETIANKWHTHSEVSVTLNWSVNL